MDQVNLAAWTGRLQHDSGQITGSMARQIRATIGSCRSAGDNDLLPPLWHWCAFPPDAAMHALGSDGHPRENPLFPPIPLQRRMWAGGSLRFRAPLRIDDPMERTSAVRSIVEKEGATGPMILLTLDHAIYGPQGLAIEERQDIVFLDMPQSFSPPQERAETGTPVSKIVPDETLLFRYSALTFNAHRIHYDKAYTQEVEKYPGLIVHGPLQATLLMQAATAHANRWPSQFDFRSVYPAFSGQPMSLSVQEDEGGLTLWTNQGGHQCMQATAIWEGTV